MNYVVLLCIKFVILLIEEKVMSYVTVSEGHGYPLVLNTGSFSPRNMGSLVRPAVTALVGGKGLYHGLF